MNNKKKDWLKAMKQVKHEVANTCKEKCRYRKSR